MEKVYEKEGILFKILSCIFIAIYIVMCLFGSFVFASDSDTITYTNSNGIKYVLPSEYAEYKYIYFLFSRYRNRLYALGSNSCLYTSSVYSSNSHNYTIDGSTIIRCYITYDSSLTTFDFVSSHSTFEYPNGLTDDYGFTYLDFSGDLYDSDKTTIKMSATLGIYERGTGDNDSSNSVSGGNTTVDGSGDEDSDSGWLDNLWDWFSNISDKIGNIANAIGETIGSIFSPLWDFITSILDWLNPFSDNFILLKLWDFLGSLVSYLNPFSENFILLKLWDFLTTVISYINPFDDNFLGKKIVELIGDLLQFLFIPSDDYFSNLKETFLSEIESKIPYNDYITMFSTVLDISTDGQIEDVSISDYKVSDDLTLNVPSFIDFSFIIKYRSTWYSWVRGIVFILLIIYHINQINKLLRGVNIADGSVNNSITFSNSLSSGNDKMLGGGK